jgi:hypothetical protein
MLGVINIVANSVHKPLIALVLTAIFISATVIIFVVVVNTNQHQPPDTWIRIGDSGLHDGPVWARLNGVWAGFNGYYLYLRIEWNNSMVASPNELGEDLNGDPIQVYGATRGVETKMDVDGVIEIIDVKHTNVAFYYSHTDGIQIISEDPIRGSKESQNITLEISLLHYGNGNLWSDKVLWRNVTARFELTSNADVSSLTNIPTNNNHMITPDGEYDDWSDIGNLTQTSGPIISQDQLGAIENVSALFCNDGLAFMMSQKEPFSEAFIAYPNLKFEAFLFFSIEAFQHKENQWFEDSYSLNLHLNSQFIRDNIVYHLSGLVISNPSEENFSIDNDRWYMGIVVEAKLLNDEIQSMLDMSEIDEYLLHFSVLFMWWNDLNMMDITL